VEEKMEDIELARSLLEEGNLNLVIVKEGNVLFYSEERGVAPFFWAVQNMGKALQGAALADRIVGLAIAMLCVHASIGSVYGKIVSQGALDLLQREGVPIAGKNIVPHICNFDGTDLCPFEKLARDCQQPSHLVAKLQSIFVQGEP
jgi:hypothetical protein